MLALICAQQVEDARGDRMLLGTSAHRLHIDVVRKQARHHSRADIWMLAQGWRFQVGRNHQPSSQPVEQVQQHTVCPWLRLPVRQVIDVQHRCALPAPKRRCRLRSGDVIEASLGLRQLAQVLLSNPHRMSARQDVRKVQTEHQHRLSGACESAQHHVASLHCGPIRSPRHEALSRPA